MSELLKNNAYIISLFLMFFTQVFGEDLKSSSNIFGGWEIISSEEVLDKDLTSLPKLQPRPWYTPWRKQSYVDKDEISSGLRSMERMLELDGFYDAKLDLTWKKEKKWTASVNVKEGERLVLDSVDWKIVPSNDLFPEDLQEKMELREGSYFSELKFQDDQQRILSYYLNRGHLWVKVEPKAQLSKTSVKAKVRYIITPGPKTSFGKTKIKGLQGLKKDLIEREFVHMEGELYSAKALRQTRANLISTRWFRSVILTPEPNLDVGESPVPLILTLQEAEPRTIGLGVGVGSEEGPRMRVSWLHRNWLSKGWSNKVQLEASFIELNFKSTVDIPKAFLPEGHGQGILSYGLINEDEYDVLVGEVEANWAYDVFEKTPMTFGWSLKNEDHSTEASILQSLSNPPERALMTGPYLTVGKSGGFLGWGNWSLSSTTRTYHDVAGNPASFWRQSLLWRSQHPLRGKWSLHPRLKVGVMDGWGSHGIPVSERFYSGGSKSVRGFSRRVIGARTNDGKQLGGQSLSEFSLELQHPIFMEGLIGALFWDGGQLDSSPSGLQLSDYRYGVGSGLGYALPMGLMRLDIGVPLKRKEWESSFQIHFDFGASF